MNPPPLSRFDLVAFGAHQFGSWRCGTLGRRDTERVCVEQVENMGDLHGNRGRPTSAVERSRSVRHEGRSARPASAGIWGGRVQMTSVPSAIDDSDGSSRDDHSKSVKKNLSASSRSSHFSFSFPFTLLDLQMQHKHPCIIHPFPRQCQPDASAPRV